MELAGIVGMQGGLNPELLKYVLVKGQEASENQTGKTTLCFFEQSNSFAVSEATSAEPPVKSVPADENTVSEASVGKQTSITDFFSPRPSTPLMDVPVPTGVKSGCVMGSFAHEFITPCPSVRFTELPVSFEVQSDCVVEDYFDPTRPLFENYSSSASVARKKAIDELKRSRTYSQPSFAVTWHDRTVSGAQNWDSSRTSPRPDNEGMPLDKFSAPPDSADTKFISASLTENALPDIANTDTDMEKYWIEKDEERLAIIANQENQNAKIKEELANAVKAFRMASDVNGKLQAELKKKKEGFSRIGGEMSDLVHNLDATEMSNETLEKELANSRIDLKHQSDRAEEALTYLQAIPSKENIAKLLRAKAEAEFRIIEQGREMYWLQSQLEERCDSVAHLTKINSRVADADQWKDVMKELQELRTKAGNLPNDLQAAWRECSEWKNKYETIEQKHNHLLSEQSVLREAMKQIEDSDLLTIQELRQHIEEKDTSVRALKVCLRKVFERMIKCSLCLEINGYSPFNEEHQEIRENIFEHMGRDYQQPLVQYYNEHNVCEEFDLDEGANENGYEDGDVYTLNNGGQAGSEEPGFQANNQEYEEGSFEPADTAIDSPSALASHSMEHESLAPTTSKESEVQESREMQEARARFIFENPVPTPAAIPKPEANDGNTLPKPIFGPPGLSIPADSTGPNGGRSFDFGFSKDSPPTLFSRFTANSETKPNQKSPVFSPFAMPQPAEAKSPAFEDLDFEQESKATEVPKEAAPGTPKETIFPPQPQDFNFGGTNSPVTFTGSSSSPAQVPPPMSAEISAFGEQTSPSMTAQAKETVLEGDDEAKDEILQKDLSKRETSKGNAPEDTSSTKETIVVDTPKNESPREKKSKKEKMPREESAANLQTATESPHPTPSPSQLSRSQKRAAKKAQEKAAKLAEMQARSAKTEDRRRVQQAMMMR